MLAAVKSESESESDSDLEQNNEAPFENDTKRVMAELELEAKAADSTPTPILARTETSEGSVDSKTKLTSDQAKKITKGIVAKIQNPKKLNTQMKKEIGKQVQANLSKENIKHAESEASKIMDKVEKKIDEKVEAKKADALKKLDAATAEKNQAKTADLKKVLEVPEPKPAADTRTDLEVLAETPTPVTDKVQMATKEILKFIELESSETCNQYITTLPKGDCMKSHSQLYSVLAAKSLSPAEILNAAMKKKMDRVKEAAWYFVSNPYQAVEHRKKLSADKSTDVAAKDKKKSKKDKKRGRKGKKDKTADVGVAKKGLIKSVDNKNGSMLVLSEKAKGYLDELWAAWQVKTVWEEEQKLMADFKKGKMDMAEKDGVGKGVEGKAAGVKKGGEKEEEKKGKKKQ